MAHDAMTLAQLARAAGEPVHVVRYYVRIGLVEERVREANGYRRFDRGALKRLEFIRRSQRLGFSLDEIGQFIADAHRGRTPCPRVRALLETRLPAVTREHGDATALLVRMQEAQRRWRRLRDRAPSGSEICRLIESTP
ncbi:MAG: MerR family transcriptional regulator [Pseudomonadota bacterium]